VPANFAAAKPVSDARETAGLALCQRRMSLSLFDPIMGIKAIQPCCPLASYVQNMNHDIDNAIIPVNPYYCCCE
jgi:hypothetical protein